VYSTVHRSIADANFQSSTYAPRRNLQPPAFVSKTTHLFPKQLNVNKHQQLPNLSKKRPLMRPKNTESYLILKRKKQIFLLKNHRSIFPVAQTTLVVKRPGRSPQ
jgi:hypothetical protein